MYQRIRVLGGAFAMAWLLAIGLAPATAAQQDVCISVDGELIYRNGSANCESTEGNTAVAVGDEAESYSTAWGGGNSAIGVGQDSDAEVLDGSSGNTSIGVNGGNAEIIDGDGNQAVSIGDDNDADIDDGDYNTLIVTRGVDVNAEILDEDYCFAVVIGNQVYGDDDCITIVDDD